MGITRLNRHRQRYAIDVLTPQRFARRGLPVPGAARLMFTDLRRDIRAVRERDPAARSTLEVLLCYPGVHALAFHRFGHAMWRRGLKA